MVLQKKRQQNQSAPKSEPFKEITLLFRAVSALFFFILGFNFSRSAFFEQYPLFGVKYLAEISISIFAAGVGFSVLPLLFVAGRMAIENLIMRTVNEIVSNFWEMQTKRIQDQRRQKQKKKAEGHKQQLFEEIKGGLLVDTSVLIDGRILDVVRLNFIDKTLVVPQAVIEELHKLSDSKDILKRKKGRRGLDILRDLKKKTRVIITNIKRVKNDVDKSLVNFAKKHDVRLFTLDFNLTKVAGVNGVKVLNLNELSFALKTVLLPGEELAIKIIQEGKEKNQGIGYLADGTMIVVEKAEELVGKEVDVKVKKVIQSPAGKIIFCVLK